MRGGARVSTASLLLAILSGWGSASPAWSAPPQVDSAKPKTEATVTAIALERLPAGGRDLRELLLVVPAFVDGKAVESADLGIGKLCKTVDPLALPGGWKCTDIGKGVNLSGPPVKTGQNLFLEFAPPIQHKFVLPFEVNLYGADKKAPLLKQQVPLQKLNAPNLQTDPKRAIRLPQRMSPGDRIRFKPLDPRFTPGGGDWKIGGLTPIWNGSFDHPVYDLEVPRDFGRGLTTPIEVSYVDPWRTKLVDGPADDVTIGPPSPSGGEAPKVTGCSPQTISGTPFCVCGDFPEDAAAELLLNGRPVGEYLVSSSPSILNFRLPDDFPVGALEVGGKRDSIEIADGVRGTLIRVNGEIDRNKLMRGEATTLKLWLDGTAEKVDLHLWNSTPSIVSLEGGEDQVVTTAGGATNDVVRTVNAVMVGDFNLHFELDIGTCPCASDDVANDDIATGDGEETTEIGDPNEDGRLDDGGPPREPLEPDVPPIVDGDVHRQWMDLADVWIERMTDADCRDAPLEALIGDMVEQQKDLEKLLEELRPKIDSIREALSLGVWVSFSDRYDLDRYRELERMLEWIDRKIIDLGLLPRCEDFTEDRGEGEQDSGGGGGITPPVIADVERPAGEVDEVERKERPRRCGPDITTAFEDAMTRAMRRIRDLPAEERNEEGGGAFLERNAAAAWSRPQIDGPQPPDWTDPAAKTYEALWWNADPVLLDACALLDSPCQLTAWLWGRCVPVVVVASLFQGMVEGMLGIPTPPGTSTQSPWFLGKLLGRGAMSDQASGTQWSGYLRDVAAEFGPRLDGSLLVPLPCAACEKCDVHAVTFVTDWTKEDWELRNGLVQKPDGTRPAPKKPEAF